MATTTAKQECLNPNTGNKMKIDKPVYDVIEKAIRHALAKGKKLTYTELATAVRQYIEKHRIQFDLSVEWYTVTVKNDLEARGALLTVVEKGKKWNMLHQKH